MTITTVVFNTKEIFLAETLSPYGTQIFIDPNTGKITTMEPSNSWSGENDLIRLSTASEEFPDEDFGVHWDTDREVYILLEGDGTQVTGKNHSVCYEDHDRAARAAVELWGMDRYHDDIVASIDAAITDAEA